VRKGWGLRREEEERIKRTKIIFFIQFSPPEL
jgi:hypothetical protein